MLVEASLALGALVAVGLGVIYDRCALAVLDGVVFVHYAVGATAAVHHVVARKFLVEVAFELVEVVGALAAE